ncbi:MAG: hypothetical protein RIT26_2247 [Pseudomonadota bacterium]|jgi:exodeoxyribonuclease VII large subunit
MNPTVWTVGALCRAVSDALSARFDAVQVRGEISGFTQAVSGHCYFTLKDAQGQLRCAMFRRSAQAMGRLPRNGDQVEVLGRLGVYETRGDLQLVVELMRPLGQGDLFAEFLRLKEKLGQEGLFEASIKRPVNTHPRRIGVVTSLGAAALHDVATALRRRVPHIPVVLSPALVQGVDAPASLMAALDRLEDSPELDVILLVRGGGSMEDLWAFNDEALVRRIRQCRVPVISGVGHEVDFTLVDFASDLRAPTPTAAAELCAVPTQDMWQHLSDCAQIIQQWVWRSLDDQAQHLDRIQNALGRPQAAMSAQKMALSRWAMRLSGAMLQVRQQQHANLQAQARISVQAVRLGLSGHAQHLQVRQTQLDLLNPQQVLTRGFCWLVDESGGAVTRAGQLSPGQSVQAVLSDGRVGMQVQSGPAVQG